MKIAYIALHLREVHYLGGVGKKIIRQKKLWEELGNEVELFILSAENFQLDQKNFFPIDDRPGILKEFRRAKILSKMIEKISEYQPDIIYLRYGLFSLPVQKLFHIAPVVLEINTLDVAEYRLRGMLLYFINLITRGIYFRNAMGMIATSHEIARDRSFAKYKLPVEIISNGVLVERPKINTLNKDIAHRIIFISSPHQYWQGVDKLIWLASQMLDMEFDVVGIERNQVSNQDIPENIHFHGFLSTQEYLSILDSADVGIGPLALYRKKMEEASPLKVREYLAHGIPSILPYKDTDMWNARYNFLLDIPNNENNVKNYLKDIRKFIQLNKGKRFDPNLIEHMIGALGKESTRVEFFRKFI